MSRLANREKLRRSKPRPRWPSELASLLEELGGQVSVVVGLPDVHLLKVTIDGRMVSSYASITWTATAVRGPNSVPQVGPKHLIESTARRYGKFYDG